MSDLELYRPRQLSRFDRFMQSIRSFSLGPFNLKDPALSRYFGSTSVSSGVSVTEHTALTYSAVWSAVNLISADIASVPLKLYKRDANGGQSPMANHPLYRLVHDRPNPQMGSAVFRRTLQAHKLVWGNGYAEIERDQAGRPIALWPLLPYAVQPYLAGNVLRYRVFNPTQPPIELDAMDMFHLRGHTEDGICGVSTIAKARESLGLGIAAERFGSTFFGNGSTFGGIISYPPGVGNNEQTRKENREAIEKRHQGPDRAHRFLALYEGATYSQLGIPPNDAQFLETREFQIEEVCRWFNIQPHKLKHLKRATFSNIEQQSIEYATDTLEPHWVDWEQESNMKLIAPLERSIQLIEHVREGRLRGDSVSRSDLQSKQFSIAGVTPNEVRSQENRNPIDGGEMSFVSLQVIPLDMARDYWQASIDKMKAPPPAPVPPPVDPNAPTPDQTQTNALQTALDLSRHATQLAEDARDIARAELAAVQETLDDVKTSHATWRELAEQERYELAAERDTYRSDAYLKEVRALAAEKERDDLLPRVTAAEADRDAVKAASAAESLAHGQALDLLQGFRMKAETDREAALALAVQAEQEQDAERAQVKAATDAAHALEAETRGILAALDVATTGLERVVAERDTALAEAEALKTDVARARADIAAALEKQRTQKGVLLAAMRSLFVDASERLIYREAERARKHQGAADKLLTWVDMFYPMHTEHVRSTFQPLVGPWTAITGGAPNVLLERLVTEHIEASTTALRMAGDTDDPDELAANLERTLSRWEHERADAMADALVREGMAS